VLLSKTLRSSSTLRLAFIYVVVFSAAIFGLLGFVYWSTVTYLYEISDRAITAESAVLTKAYEAGGRDGLVTLINRRLADEHFNDWVYLLVNQSFDHLAGNARSWPAPLREHEGWRTLSPADWPSETQKRLPLRATYQTLPNGHHLLIGRNINDLERFGNNVTIGLASAAMLFLILAAAAGISTSRRSVARIEAINATSRKIMRSGLGERIPLRGTDDEWDGLAENLNSMLDRIEELVETNRQVSENVAHDLRTPLTRIRGRLERACNEKLDLVQYQSLVIDTISGLDEVLMTFSSLLRISHIEARDPTAAFRDIDLSGVVREVVELFEPAADEKGVRLLLSAGEAVSVIGDRDLLFDAISNLVDNALKHGQGEVEIAVEQAVDGPLLWVADHGPGIPIAERKHVLRRFYRLERSRNSPGNGLGLSLIAAVANLHDARIEMTENSPGLRIELHFPMAQRTTSSMSDRQSSHGQLASSYPSR